MSAALRLPCAGCGREYDRADMLEATLPDRTVGGDPHFPAVITLGRLDWVGPCCAELANEWQP